MHWNIFAQQIAFGFVNNIGYALVAIGLTLIFGIMNVTNFAHGEFYMLGSFLISLLSKLAFLKSLISQGSVPRRLRRENMNIAIDTPLLAAG